MREVLRKRLADRTDEGFTLIELMVVVLIIAILLAIAIPTFLGARTKAQDRAAQSDARNALTAAKTYYVDLQHYDNSTVSAFTGIEPSLKMVASFSATYTPHEVQVLTGDVQTGDKNVICITAKSASGKFFEVKDIATADTANSISAGTTFDTPSAAPTTCNSTALTGKW
jgi:type IV pilus assembly protein PilA